MGRGLADPPAPFCRRSSGSGWRAAPPAAPRCPPRARALPRPAAASSTSTDPVTSPWHPKLTPRCCLTHPEGPGSSSQPFDLPFPTPNPFFFLPSRDRHDRAQHLQEAPDLPAERWVGWGGVCPVGWGIPGCCLTLPVPPRPPFQRPPREASHRGLDHRILQIPGGAAPGSQPARQDRDRLLAVPPVPGRRG